MVGENLREENREAISELFSRIYLPVSFTGVPTVITEAAFCAGRVQSNL
ncbi:hypothetical protein DEAC_c35800 [Desulfosporosinus acididurans]|uniref:Uncharacterized protein n=1 Tax=Desulfosporosinus acididurans TaxID=476652 RepID=A0A0J1FN40_9FIRM|nr:hypothetical protein DEAC_c35800 [Desulfosporosinus acididurans]